MPADNVNTRTIQYIGEDPELRKYINKWDSVIFDYDEFEGEKFLFPRCGMGYMIHRNVKDVFIKIPPEPYDGDMFAIMDITDVNEDYITEHYRSKGKLIKENPITKNLNLTTGRIYVDNTCEGFTSYTKVIFDKVIYNPGDVFELTPTCCYIYVFTYSKSVNAWSIEWVEKECINYDCGCNVKVIIRYSIDGTKETAMHEDVFSVPKNALFRKAYKNYEIYNFYSVNEAHEQSVDVRDYVEVMREMATWTPDTQPEPAIFKFSEHDFFQHMKYLSHGTEDGVVYYDNNKLICTNNTIDKEVVFSFPFETGTNGIFYDVNIFIEYFNVYIHVGNIDVELFNFQTQRDDFWDDEMSKYAYYISLRNYNTSIDNEYYNYLKAPFSDIKGGPEDPTLYRKYEIQYYNGPGPALIEKNSIILKRLKNFGNWYVNGDRTIVFDLVFNTDSHITTYHFDGKDFIFNEAFPTYVEEKYDNRIDNFLSELLGERLGHMGETHIFTTDYYEDPEIVYPVPMTKYFEMTFEKYVPSLGGLADLMIKDLTFTPNFSIVKSDFSLNFWGEREHPEYVDTLTVSGYLPEDYVGELELYPYELYIYGYDVYTTHSIATITLNWVHTLFFYSEDDEFFSFKGDNKKLYHYYNGNTYEVRFSYLHYIFHYIVDPETGEEPNEYNIKNNYVYDFLMTTAPFTPFGAIRKKIDFVTRTYPSGDPQHGSVNGSKYAWALYDKRKKDIRYINHVFSRQSGTHFYEFWNRSSKFYDGVSYGIYDITQMIDRFEEWLEEETVFEFVPTGNETIINVFWSYENNSYYNPYYYGNNEPYDYGNPEIIENK